MRVHRVWAVIYPPSYQPPADQEDLVQEGLSSINLFGADNDRYSATYTGFDEHGVYRIVFCAEDNERLDARPMTVKVRIG